MKKKSLLFIVLLIFIKINAQNNIYQPTWESLDTRPTPAWFKNAKFGIFIHWGIYSVPMWSPKGTYEEWYKYWLDNKKLMGNGEFIWGIERSGFFNGREKWAKGFENQRV